MPHKNYNNKIAFINFYYQKTGGLVTTFFELDYVTSEPYFVHILDDKLTLGELMQLTYKTTQVSYFTVENQNGDEVHRSLVNSTDAMDYLNLCRGHGELV
ncbi:hypothetical protein J2750_002137 [Methanococcoides alaskense]|uniref:Uncharacterized protein n=1 Tax=Methanococcoides alaskense TaxID=325778 RepID=A0AA90U1R6_9EURY|nr:hypothetical protein [Methanococcoides alaskense]